MHAPVLQVIDFYEYYEGLQEGWDGPALLVFSDGNKIGARLDRNGLRPARFWETDDGMVYVASEVGVLGDVLSNASHIVRKGRLGPGQMVCADLADVSVSFSSLQRSCYAIGQKYLACDRGVCCMFLLPLPGFELYFGLIWHIPKTAYAVLKGVTRCHTSWCFACVNHLF